MVTLDIQNLLLRPFGLSEAPTFTEAMRKSLVSIQPWMLWAHAGYSALKALEWFRFNQAGRGATLDHALRVISGDWRRFFGRRGSAPQNCCGQ